MIRVESLSKQYRIGARTDGRFQYQALRDVLSDALASPFRSLWANSKSAIRNPKLDASPFRRFFRWEPVNRRTGEPVHLPVSPMPRFPVSPNPGHPASQTQDRSVSPMPRFPGSHPSVAQKQRWVNPHSNE